MSNHPYDPNPMRFPRNPTEQDYYDRVQYLFEDVEVVHLTDVIASMDEWQMAKAALLRWIAKHDKEWTDYVESGEGEDLD